MLNHVEESRRPLTSTEIERVEGIIGIVFPEDYKEFLLNHNGGRPVPCAFPLIGLDANPFGEVHYFFGIDDTDEAYDLLWNYDTFMDRLPNNLLGIGCDAGGDLICLSCSGDDVGTVVFWDHHNVPEAPDYSNVYFIANSFSEFLDSLCELPDDYE